MTQDRSKPIANVVTLSHIDLEVSDLRRSIDFYEQVLGLDIFQDERDDPAKPNIKGLVGDFALELHQRTATPCEIAGGAGLAPSPSPCVTFSVENIDDAFAALKRTGHARGTSITHMQGVKMFFVRDPDGYTFELIQFPTSFKTLADLAPLMR